MVGRILALVSGGAMAALALYLRDPAIYGPTTPALSLGPYETFRSLMIFGAGVLALCGLLGAFQPGPKTTSATIAPLEPAEAPAMTTEETAFEPEQDAFRIRTSPAASPLW